MRIAATSLVPGVAEGDVFVLAEPLSFWGGLDSGSGAIIDQWHSQVGQILTGRIVVMSAGRGSSSGSSVLAEAIRLGTGPAAIILLQRDAIVTIGAMIATELYGRSCPVVLAERAAWSAICAARQIAVTAEPGDAALQLTS